MDNENNNIDEHLDNQDSVSEDDMESGDENVVDDSDYSDGYGQPVGYSPGGFRRGLVSGYNNVRRDNNNLKENIEKNKSKNVPKGNDNSNYNQNDNQEDGNKNKENSNDKSSNNSNKGNGLVGENTENKGSSNLSNLLKFKVPTGLKLKIIIGAVIVGVVLLLGIILLLGASSIVLKLFDDDSDSDSSSLSYSTVGDDSGFWWPIGSTETTTKNGKTFAAGQPALTAISSPFSSYRALTGRPHYGFDVGSGGKIGVYNLIAIKSGTVVKVNNTCDDNGYLHNKCGGELGNYITIDHGNGYYSRYQHMAKDSVTVRVGDTVEQGQVIGKIGKSGSCTGAHLHFQIHVGGTSNSNAVNPEKYVSASNPRPVATVSNKFTQGSSVQQSVCLTLKNAGFDNTAVAAILGNMYHESSFNPSVKNYLGCLGLTQWCFGRKNTLVARYGNNWTSVDNQMEYLLWEYNGGDFRGPIVVKYLKESHSAGDKAYYYCNKFEVPGESECRRRISTAEGFTSYVNNGCK